MCFGMLSLGNLGMLLGWWMDNGFGPLHHAGCRECLDAVRAGTSAPGMWLGMLLFGRAQWLGHGEVFSLVFGLLARFAPTEVRESSPRVRALNLRPYGVGLLSREPVPASIVVLVLAMILCAVLGIVIEKLAYRPLRQRPKLTVLITAIGVSLFLEYAGQKFFKADPKKFPELIPNQQIHVLGSLVVSTNQLLVLVDLALVELFLRVRRSLEELLIETSKELAVLFEPKPGLLQSLIGPLCQRTALVFHSAKAHDQLIEAFPTLLGVAPQHAVDDSCESLVRLRPLACDCL
jgi:hypothetical protein